MSEELIRAAVKNLRDIDRQPLYWIDLALARRDDYQADVDWEQLDWDGIKARIEAWLSDVEPRDCPRTLQVPVREDAFLVFQARARTEDARGWKTKPSLVLAETWVPPIWLDDGTQADLFHLPRHTVEDLANGRRHVVMNLPSHRETWEMLLGMMMHFGHEDTSEMSPAMLETYASMLGLTEAPPELGDFDTTWRALNDPGEFGDGE